MWLDLSERQASFEKKASFGETSDSSPNRGFTYPVARAEGAGTLVKWSSHELALLPLHDANTIRRPTFLGCGDPRSVELHKR